ncbi:hypothetical protein GCM10009122_08590 [Fulvivirga kasyanovii]|uniref:T9SS C-terminal target domain-containing protein n=1 Tax=Fulvivirga kasyanovii TaxID=396812 RepID=A0ABW9RRM4_9BACT|nr:hypothetical protein [Fulvivirga kasyanovii]MTI26351.1 hypothetical protein [Fulvivirga kasyanovii]
MRFKEKSIVVIIFLTSFIFLGFVQSNQESCSSIIVRAKTSSIDPGLAKGEVIIEVENAQKPISYLFYDKNQKALSDDVTNNHVSGLKSGKYFVSIIDNSGCMRTVEFTI